MLQREQSLQNNWEDKRTNALPADQSMAEAQLFKSFDRWERSSGITPMSRSSRNGKRRTQEDYMTLECRADYTGDIDRIKRFLFEVEKDPTGLRKLKIWKSPRATTAASSFHSACR